MHEDTSKYRESVPVGSVASCFLVSPLPCVFGEKYPKSNDAERVENSSEGSPGQTLAPESSELTFSSRILKLKRNTGKAEQLVLQISEYIN